MANTVYDAIVRARRAYGDIPDAVGLAYAQDLQRELVAAGIAYREVYSLTTLLTSTGVYSLPARILGIESATYVESSTEVGLPLEVESVENWDVHEPGWRNETTGTPTRIATSPSSVGSTTGGAMTVILRSPPDTATATTGYPKVDLVVRGAEATTLTTTSSLPLVLKNPEKLAGRYIAARYAEDNGMADYPLREDRWQASLAEESKSVRERARDAMPVATPIQSQFNSRMRVV